MRRGAKRDRNHGEIRNLLRSAGCTVEDTGDVGNGFPDLVVRTPRGCLWLVEVKDGELPPSARMLTEAETSFSLRWPGHYVVVTTVDEALDLLKFRAG